MNDSLPTEKISSIRCTACGAPLTLHGGGHKIQTLNCAYCGAVMDARHDFAVLAQFANQHRPECPLELGMQGKLKGVDFTIIGMIAWFAEGEWLDLLLYSPTHGYAWLSYEQGHFSFSRRIRELMPANMWEQTTKSPIYFRDQRFLYWEHYQAEITYVAGELTWLAKVGDTVWQAEAISPPLLLSAEKNNDEAELYLSEYLSVADIKTAFQLKDSLPEPVNVHPAQPYDATTAQAVSRVGLIFAGIAAVAVLIIWLLFSGKVIFQETLPLGAKQTQQTHEFTITQPQHLVRLDMSTSINNAWLYAELTLQHNGKAIYALGKEVSYYEGYEDGESWSEGSRFATALFKVPEAGRYTLALATPEGGIGEDSANATLPTGVMTLTLREGFMGKRYFLWLLLIAGIASLWYPIARWYFEYRRWQPQMEDEA